MIRPLEEVGKWDIHALEAPGIRSPVGSWVMVCFGDIFSFQIDCLRVVLFSLKSGCIELGVVSFAQEGVPI